jgi:hypothetical protein
LRGKGKTGPTGRFETQINVGETQLGIRLANACTHQRWMNLVAACLILTDSRKRNASLERGKLLKRENFHGPTLTTADGLIDTGEGYIRSDLSASHSPRNSGKGAVRRSVSATLIISDAFPIVSVPQKHSHARIPHSLLPVIAPVSGDISRGLPERDSSAGLSHRDQ